MKTTQGNGKFESPSRLHGRPRENTAAYAPRIPSVREFLREFGKNGGASRFKISRQEGGKVFPAAGKTTGHEEKRAQRGDPSVH
jgi:hypothetical protein